jgi:hypothetical protein
MKKLFFLTAAGIGFVLGSKAGTGPYEQLERQLRKVTGRPEVQGAVGQAKDAATGKIDDLAHKVSDKLPSHDDTTQSSPAGVTTTPTGTEPSGY